MSTIGLASGTRDRAEPAVSSRRNTDFVYHRFFALGDLLAIVLACGLAIGLMDFIGRGSDITTVALTVALIGPVWFAIAYGAGQYHEIERRIDFTYVDEFGSVAIAATVWCWLFMLVWSLIAVEGTGVLAPVLIWVSIVPLVLGSRALVRRIAQRRSWGQRPVAVIGDQEGIEALTQRIERNPGWGLDVKMVAGFDENHEIVIQRIETPGGIAEAFPAAHPLRERELATQLVVMDVSRAIIAGGSRNLSAQTRLVHELIERGIAVDQISGGPETLYSNSVLLSLEGLPVLSVRPTSPRPMARRAKRFFDIVVSGFGLVLFAPILLWAAVRIKLDSKGPIFYRQERCGYNSDPFEVIKLRTMVDGAHGMRESLRNDTFDSGNDDVLFKLKEDPRVTSFGEVLRRTSLDEVPQLWNVFRGDMSMVGPRPLVFEEALQATDIFSARTRMKPGIAGPWQSLGRSSIPFEDMIKLDYAYVVGWSMSEDLRLLFRTVGAVARRSGAH